MITRRLPRLPNRIEAAPESGAPAEALVPQHYAHPGLSLQQILVILRSHWRQTAIIFVSITALAAIVVKLLPKTYEATATLIVDLQNKDPLAAQAIPLNMLQNYVATQAELMQSPAVLSDVVDLLKLTKDEDYTSGFHGSDPNGLREYVEKNLATTITVNTGTGGQLLYIAADAKNPARAAQVANTVADVYLEQERRRLNDPASERAQRYSAELAELRAKATAAQDQVTQFRQKNGITDINAINASTEVEALNNLEQRLLEAQNARRALEAKLVNEGSASDAALGSQLIGGLRAQLDTEEAQLAQLRAVYGPVHPKIRELESQAAATRHSLDAAVQQLKENDAGDLMRAKQLESTTAAAVAAQQAKVLHLRQLQDEGAKLMLVLESAQTVYKSALDG